MLSSHSYSQCLIQTLLKIPRHTIEENLTVLSFRSDQLINGLHGADPQRIMHRRRRISHLAHQALVRHILAQRPESALPKYTKNKQNKQNKKNTKIT